MINLSFRTKILLCGFLLATVISLLTIDFWRFLNHPLVTHESKVEFIIPQHVSAKTLANELAKANVIDRPYYLVWYLRWWDLTKKLQAGEYQFQSEMDLHEMVDLMIQGKVIYRDLTFVEGITFKEMLATINQEPRLVHQLTDLTAAEMITKLGLTTTTLEGQFFPDTYQYTAGMSDVDVLKRASQLMQNNLLKSWDGRAKEVDYKSPEQALIVASLIEKETALADERAIIAGIILKRLKIRMPLQIDASVIYGLGQNYQGKLSRDDLKIDTVYNTYLHYGLPPTPIAMPSKLSIEAALHPNNTGALYYVAKGDGSHYFSKTLKEHKQAVNRYHTMSKNKWFNQQFLMNLPSAFGYIASDQV